MQTISTFGKDVHLLLSQHFKKTIKHESAVLEDKDPEAIHDMRVGMRRLRTALQVFEPAIVFPEAGGVEPMRRMARVLGAVRDADVLKTDLETHYYPQLQGKEQKRLREVLRYLQQQRQEGFGRLQAAFKGSEYRKLKRAVQNWLENPVYKPLAALSAQAIVPDLLLPLTSEVLLHPGWLIGMVSGNENGKADGLDEEHLVSHLQEQEEVLHDLRKRMKGMRYQMEFFVDWPGLEGDDRIKGLLSQFKQVQEVLGQLQDLAVLKHFLQEALQAPLADKLPTLGDQLRQRQIQLWQAWQPLQQQFLDANYRAELRSHLLLPTALPSEPASETVDDQADVLLESTSGSS
ncbi:MAG: CHAD domain-containing protein [Leptolyngbyaceae cyanobacterium bins.59]|nr:CHAD domain-containing protein [Leptolyngbyaceae cyanobacterium bins.59]